MCEMASRIQDGFGLNYEGRVALFKYREARTLTFITEIEVAISRARLTVDEGRCTLQERELFLKSLERKLSSEKLWLADQQRVWSRITSRTDKRPG